jgi:hypothetical protein
MKLFISSLFGLSLLMSGCAYISYDGNTLKYNRFLTDYKVGKISASKTKDGVTLDITGLETDTSKAIEALADTNTQLLKNAASIAGAVAK